jgi:release factor glutamine methyltransferase
VSNPPYIRQASSVDLMPEVVDYEPHIALFGDGVDGLGVIKRLTHKAVEILPSGGGLFIEVGYDQTLESAAYLTQVGFQDVRIRRDYGGQPRVVSGFKN